MSKIKRKVTVMATPKVFAFEQGTAEWTEVCPYHLGFRHSVIPSLPEGFFFDFDEVEKGKAREMAEQYSAFWFRFYHAWGYPQTFGGRFYTPFKHIHQVFVLFEKYSEPIITTDKNGNLRIWADLLGGDYRRVYLDREKHFFARMFVQKTISPKDMREMRKEKNISTFYLKTANDAIRENSKLISENVTTRAFYLNAVTENRQYVELLRSMLSRLREFEKQTATLQLKAVTSLSEMMEVAASGVSSLGLPTERVLNGEAGKIREELISYKTLLQEITAIKTGGALTDDMKGNLVDLVVDTCGIDFVRKRVNRAGDYVPSDSPFIKAMIAMATRGGSATTPEEQQRIISEAVISAMNAPTLSNEDKGFVMKEPEQPIQEESGETAVQQG